LRECVARLHPDLARVCAYHAGWGEADGRPARGGGGKLLRASLALLAARASGGDPAVATPGAVAVELVHDFSLLHDDIMDGDVRRRGRPAAWVVFGRDLATLAGDALIAAAFRAVPSATDLLAAALERMTDGQAADLALEGGGPDGIDVDDYLRACDKTTALLETALGIGAVLGGVPARTAEPLRLAGRNLGLSWQVANDVEDIWGDPSVTGKPALSDLRRSKKTIPVILALRAGNPSAALLREALSVPAVEPTDAALHVQSDLVARAGGRAGAERLARDHLDAAFTHLADARLAPELHDEFVGLFRYVVHRA
jgi:geranylgeranyl diphosphate synthase type I